MPENLMSRALLPLLCALCFVAGSWHTPLFDLDEGAFAQATLEMLRGGDWLTTQLDGLPRYDKPMLSYWLQALAVRVLGPVELAFRLPSMLAAGLWCWATLRFVREQTGDAAAGHFAAAALAGSLMVGVIAHAATADALLNLFLALSFFELWRWLSVRQLAALRRAYLWIGLGMLVKGPVAAILPLLAGIAFCARYGRWRDARRALLDGYGWLILLGVLGLWLLPLALAGKLDFVWQFLLQHNLGRYREPAESHGGGPAYYLLWLPLVLLPFSALLPVVARRARQWRDDPLLGFALAWALPAFLVFSLASTKLPHYILYACTPLFVLFGREHARLRSAWLLLPGSVLIALLAALPLLAPLLPLPKRAYDRGIVELALQQFGWSYAAIALLALLGLGAVWAMRTRPLAQRLMLLALGQALLVWLGAVPVLAAAQQQPVREAGQLAASLATPTVVYRTQLPSFSVYRGAATPHRSPQAGELVFLRRDRIDALRQTQPALQFETLYENGGVALLRAQPVSQTAAEEAPR